MQRLRDLAISDTGFVFDPFSGATYTVNGTAQCLLDGLKRGLDRDGLVALLRERFECSDEDLPRDIDDLTVGAIGSNRSLDQLQKKSEYLERVMSGAVQLYLYQPDRDRIVEMIGNPSASTTNSVTYVPGTDGAH